MASQSPFSARARTDARDWLVEADEPLASMQLRNGGEMPGPIVAPALLELVQKARAYKLKMGRAISARDDLERVNAWVEVEPDEAGQGCALTISNWQIRPAVRTAPNEDGERRIALIRQLAEFSARLGAQHQVLTADSDAGDLAALVNQMRSGIGRPWTDFVAVEGNSHEQPVHWRLLDGAKLTIAGSDRGWTAHIVPIVQARQNVSAFELLFLADRPLPDAPKGEAPSPQIASNPAQSLGSEIAPVLRQPISRIIANAETIRTQLAGPLAPEYSDYAADIASAAEHLLSLIDDLTTLELVEGEDFAPEKEQIDLADLAGRAAGILGVRAQKKQIKIDTPKPDEKAPAIADFKRVLQILLNLLGNAIRYSPEDSQIWLRVEQNGSIARIIVADQGEGLDGDEQSRVFGKFERLGRSGDGGSGLGLYISRRLARAMDGDLKVESAKGQGARFILELPADADAAE